MKIIYVDDEDHFLDQVKRYLERKDEDLEVYTAKSAKVALEIFNENEYDAIISDYMMPELNGIEFLKKIRKEKGSSIPFIIFTGKGREEVAMEALNIGADRYFTKVGDPRSVYDLIYEAIVEEIEHREKAEMLVELNSLLSSIRGIDRLIAQEEDLDTLFQKSSQLLLNTGGYLNVEFAILDEKDEMIRPSVSSGKHDHWEWEISVDGEGNAPYCVKEVVNTHSTVQITGEKGYCKDCEYPEPEKIDHHTVLLPMIHEEELYGILIVCHKSNRFISNRELELLKEVVDDLTLARRRMVAEKTLKEERDLFVEGPTILFKWKAEKGWPIEYVSRNVEEILGYEQKKLLENGKNYTEILPDADKERIEREIKIHKNMGSMRINLTPYRIIKKDGDVIWVKDYTKIVYSGENEIKYYLGYLVDITEQKSVEEALQKSEERYRRIFETAQDGILLLSAKNGRIKDANPYIRDLLGYSLEELQERKIWSIESFKNIIGNKEEFREAKDEGLLKKQEVELKTKDGQTILVECRCKTYRSGGEKVIQCNIRESSNLLS